MRANTIKVQFSDVGREHKTWTADVREDPSFPGTPDADQLVRALRLGRALMSRDLDVTVDDDGRSGACLAGLRSVGKWSVLV